MDVCMHVCMYVCTPVSHQNNLRAVLCLMEKFERTKSQLPFDENSGSADSREQNFSAKSLQSIIYDTRL